MLGMELSDDSRYAVAFTKFVVWENAVHFYQVITFFSTNQLIIVDIMLGHFIRVEKPMAENDDIIDLCLTSTTSQDASGHIVILFNNSYFR